MNPGVDACIRRSQMWPEEIAGLRPILLGRGLTEEMRYAPKILDGRGFRDR